MSNQLGSWLWLAVFGFITLALFAGLRQDGEWLAKQLKEGYRSAHNHAGPRDPTVFADALAGVTIQLPEGVTPQLNGLGVLLKRDSDAQKAALVCPLIADRSMAPAEVLTAVHRVWEVGMKDGDTLTLGNVYDEGTMVHASLESGRGVEALAGELRVRRAPPGLRIEAFWTPKDEFDKERASLEALTRAITFTPGEPLAVQVGAHHMAGVPPGYVFTEDGGGIEVSLKSDARVVFGLATGRGNGGLTKSEQLIDQYLTKSQGLSNATTGLSRAYPTIDAPTGQTWDITARDLEYDAAGQHVHAVITAGLTHGKLGQAFLLAVRQAPIDDWARHGFTLSAIESTARYLPEGAGAAGLAIPIAHPEATWELLEGWAVGRAMRNQGPERWREALLPFDQRVNVKTRKRWAFPAWSMQPDGSYLDPEDPLQILALPDR